MTLWSWWAARGATVLRISIATMGFAAIVFLTYAFWRLLVQPEELAGWAVHPGAIDLKLLHTGVQSWFAGKGVYAAAHGSTYPPASHAILWPVFGWLPFTPVLWLWALSSAAALVWLAHLLVRESGAETRLERLFVGLLPFCCYASGATIGNGQLIVHLLPVLIAGLLLLEPGVGTRRGDLLGALLILIALVKPTVAAPFFWIVIWRPGRLRPALAVAIGYAALTLWAARFQEAGLLELIRAWVRTSSRHLGVAGYADLHLWLASAGLEAWIPFASLSVLLLLGLWIHRHRRVDPWLLIGVTAIVARFWSYHGWYDDLLILLPATSLFRLAKSRPCLPGADLPAGILLAATAVSLLAPGGLYLLPPPLNGLYVAGQVLVWTTVLLFLGRCAGRQRSSSR